MLSLHDWFVQAIRNTRLSNHLSLRHHHVRMKGTFFACHWNNHKSLIDLSLRHILRKFNYDCGNVASGILMNNRHVTLFSAAHGKTLKEYETEFSMDAPAAAPELPPEPHIVVPQQVLEVRQSCSLIMPRIICIFTTSRQETQTYIRTFWDVASVIIERIDVCYSTRGRDLLNDIGMLRYRVCRCTRLCPASVSWPHPDNRYQCGLQIYIKHILCGYTRLCI